MSVADFFIDKNVFITGGSGFLGKLIIEKLLRSCPGIGKIYVLLRPRKGKAIEERLEKIIESPIFNPLRHQNPDALRKLIPIKGDVSELNLGISKEDRELLVNTVNIIYHSAASVRFDDFLKDAIILNVRGTREVAKLALDLKSISIFVHISTTYCNCDKLVVEEKLYPAHTSWRDAIMLAEECDQQTLETLTQKYISPLPNTYTFAKSLGEHVVNDLCQGKIPTIITRPSVVMNTESDPIQGYTDNFNGPVGLVTAAGKGLVRVGFGKPDTITDYIPADYVIKGMVLATASQGITKLVKLVRKIYIAYTVLAPFVCNTYWFLNDKYINMQKDLKEEDSAFSFNYKSWTDEEMYEFIKGGKLGMEVYLFGEKLGVTGSKAKQKMMKYWLAEVIFKTILLTVFLWIFMYKLNFFNLATIKTISYFNSLSS
ncbi:putative fatty acyl-CoA reductase CG5065 isoform X3 [Diabrotica virgifera virgifera]|uniref:Fatty acyl-CoA reductase n=1 Tax=Diabrotica virgifera virgifera TaxID=50390 RepID=A0ABM5K2W6_DIAVI|nr:putative fatty acyl-CoA reductase CG5065 isoform X3 [Diabrotica virgifera virgifera]